MCVCAVVKACVHACIKGVYMCCVAVLRVWHACGVRAV